MEQEKVLEILRVISNPTRMEILRRIRAMKCDAGVTCTSVLEGMEISQSTLSHHVSELSQTGLVAVRTEGRCSMLTIDESVWADFQQHLEKTIFG